MDIKELVVFLQTELQRSYDYASEAARAAAPNGGGVLHLNFEQAELELPVLLDVTPARLAEADLKDVSPDLAFIKVPFNLNAQIRAPRAEGAEPPRAREAKGPRVIEGQRLDVTLANPRTLLDARAGPSTVGRLKVVFKPVVS